MRRKGEKRERSGLPALYLTPGYRPASQLHFRRCWRYMRSNVYVTAGCPVDRQQQRRRAAGLLLSARRGQQISIDSWHAQ